MLAYWFLHADAAFHEKHTASVCVKVMVTNMFYLQWSVKDTPSMRGTQLVSVVKLW